MSPHRALRPAAALLLALAACDAGGVKLERAAARAAARADDAPAGLAAADGRAARAPEPPLGPDDVALASGDSAILVVMRGDSIRLRLGSFVADSVQGAVAAALDSTVGEGSAIGRMATRIATRVTEEVANAAMVVAVADVERVERVGGGLRLRTRQGGNVEIGTSRSGDGDGARHAFAPADVERFAAAVEARRQDIAARAGREPAL